ncbi:MHYT domain-containing protein [Actinocrispum wychmicini]|uniref:NO-binding membrane sensor protein with MHYT domain n=1 Tax=Actinocrispum wychmicini TaxID=1213861 RepID=A0A4R2J4D2_9PSEU|nr:MHYT domain-containing protein [Actinocrispum wychmicini]TCO53523.1 NO-binding membrane sensor protein with MHYT domain [Actinocrispum wychmicini]
MLGFSFNSLTAFVAYVASVVGSALGLLCTSRARIVRGSARARWLVLAALSIGGTGIWVMHFIAMLGSTVDGTPLLYNVRVTVLSMILAVLVVAVGVFVVGFTEGLGWIVVGGVFTGAGVAIMHYVGMSAITMYGEIHYSAGLVVASVVIGVVAATAALWATVNIRGAGAILVAALIMGIAVNGMHHTGMAAAHVQLHSPTGALTGMSGQDLLFPLIAGIGFITMVTLSIVVLSPSEKEMAEEAALQDRITRALGSNAR